MKEQTQKANISEVRVAANSMLADCLPVSGGAPLPLTRHIGKIRDWLQDQNHPPLPVLPYDGGADQADRTMTRQYGTHSTGPQQRIFKYSQSEPQREKWL